MLICAEECERWVSHDCEKEVRDGFAIDDATVIAGASIFVGSAALRAPGVFAAADEEVSHSAGAIHQEVILKAQRARVYAALADSQVVSARLVLLSGAVKSGMLNTTEPARISGEAGGGTFAIFGGHISGRIDELGPERHARPR